jgi:hypothetical protein
VGIPRLVIEYRSAEEESSKEESKYGSSFQNLVVPSRQINTIFLYPLNYIKSVVMLKLEEEKPQEHQIVREILQRIRSKLAALGFSRQEIMQQIQKAVNQALKVKATDFRDMRRLIISRLAEKQNKQVTLQLIVELDLFLTSIYDNYDSEPEEKNLKM